AGPAAVSGGRRIRNIVQPQKR
ncbi:MAG: hypothetical protein QOH19_430, partial [Actinomycetota bacterium]|nr:hypothetical protein [Actinomycetota bacterium]